jgi:2',3'-cyclic-nucleotide 2'-phosphodiesterase
LKVLLIGDIVGRPGREAVEKIVPQIRKDKVLDFVIANAENVAGGSGLTSDIADDLFKNQIDVITSGDHIWRKREIYARLEEDLRILRPANFPDGCPGRGSTVIKSNAGTKVGVINLLGRVFMSGAECPFRAARKEIDKISEQTDIILVDIHAEATSEKVALGRFLEGKVSAVIGTHTHVQTADEKILEKGTAYITDLGMTGPQNSVIGRKVECVIERFMTSMPVKFEIADQDIELQGVIVEIDVKSGKAVSIERVKEKLKDYL